MRILRHSVVVAVVLMLLGTVAMADIEKLDDYLLDEGLGNPDAERQWVEGIAGFTLSFIGKEGSDGETIGVSFEVDFDGSSATLSWDLSGTGWELRYIMLKGGSVDGKFLYALYEVKDGQYIMSDDVVVQFNQALYSGKNISHISLFGVRTSVPEPTTLLLLGAGLLGVGILGRKLR